MFVPPDHETAGPGYVKVTYDKKQVKDAPSIGTDGKLPAGEEGSSGTTAWLTSQAPAASGGWPAAERPD